MKSVSILILSLSLALFTACNRDGTETGNPEMVSPITDGDNIAPLTFTGQLITNSCERIRTCNGIDADDCSASWLNREDVAPELGANPLEFTNLRDLMNGEVANSVTPNETTAEQCLTAIENLNCSAPEVQNAYDITSPTPYGNGRLLIPTVCEDAF